MNSDHGGIEIYNSLCRMCDDHCGIKVIVQDGRVVDIQALENHPWNRGRLCVKGGMGVDQVNAPDRLLEPLKKKGRDWMEIPLEQALDEIAERIIHLQKKYGDRAVGLWKGEAVGFQTQEGLARRFIHAIGSPNYFSNDTQCMLGRWIGYRLVAGVWPRPDFSESKCMVFWGANPPHAHPNMSQHIMDGRDKGGKIIVIDSRFSAIARQADVFLQVLPGTDGAMALGLARELINIGSIDKEFIDNYSVGYEQYASYVESFTPQRVEKETGIPSRMVEKVAKMMADAAPKVTNYVGNGLEHHENGVNNVRAIACLDGLLGSLDVRGGGFISECPKLRELTLYEEKPLLHLEPIGADKYPVLYDLRKECHTLTAMDVMLTGKPYPLRGMIITGANPALTNANTKKVIPALKSLDLLVSRELWMTETSRLADYILPAATYLEHSELHCHDQYQILGLTPKIVSFPDCQGDYMFYRSLAVRLGAEGYFPWESEDELNDWLLEDTGITREMLFAAPEGYHYKPREYRKYRTEKLNTPSGKFEFASDYIRDLGYQHLPEYLPPAYKTSRDPEYPFVLITGARKVVYCHGRYRNFARSRTAIPNPEIELHPADADKLRVKSGDIVTVTSWVGSVDIPVQVMEPREIMPGVVHVTHGWQEANINLITPDDRNDPINGFPLLKAVPVQITAKNTP